MLSLFIDKITNSIEEVISKQCLETEIILLKQVDLKLLGKKNGWQFNWSQERKWKERKLYKLVIKGDCTIQGLISLQFFSNFIELQLIETAPHNLGKFKKYSGVAGNLVAFGCKLSYENGYDGYVSFLAKNSLITHYINTLGAELIFKNRMAISGNSAKNLVNSYYKNHFTGE